MKIINFISDFLVLKIMPLFQFKVIGKVLGLTKKLSYDDKVEAYRILKLNYGIVLTYEELKLSSWLINLSSKLLLKNKSGKFGHFSHASGNVPQSLIKNEISIPFMESVSEGVREADFFEVFDVNAACILMPKLCSDAEWFIVMQSVVAKKGSKYDTLFNPNDKKYSCAELWLSSIMELPNWRSRFPGLYRILDSGISITPEMFAISADFHIVYNIRR